MCKEDESGKKDGRFGSYREGERLLLRNLLGECPRGGSRSEKKCSLWRGNQSGKRGKLVWPFLARGICKGGSGDSRETGRSPGNQTLHSKGRELSNRKLGSRMGGPTVAKSCRESSGNTT